MKTEAFLFTLLMVLWPIFLLYLLKIRPNKLFRKNLNQSVIQSLRMLGINQVFNAGTEFRFKGIYQDHTVSLTTKKNSAIKAFIQVVVTFKVNTQNEDHHETLTHLNQQLEQITALNAYASKWEADEVRLSWDVPLNAITFDNLKDKIDSAVLLVEKASFTPLGSLNTPTQFNKDWKTAFSS